MEHFDTISDSLDMIATMAYVLIGVLTLGVCIVGGGNACGEDKYGNLMPPDTKVPLGLSCCIRLVVIIFASIQMANLNDIGKPTARNIDELESNSDVDCSDINSRIDVGPAMDQMEESNALLGSAYACTIAAYLWIVLEICCACILLCFGENAYREINCRTFCIEFKEEAKYFF